MTVFPIIGRELRAAARHSFSYHLRVLGVAALLLAGFLFGMDHGFGSNMGAALFGNLHFTLFLAIWILVPMLTADCISRERREGTLGLLFLTELKAGGVVVAKSVAHGLRALTLWFAVLPVLTVPVLMGGVSWGQGALSFLINLSAICWALSAGLLASALSKSWLRALLNSALLAALFLLCMGVIAGDLLAPVFSRRIFLISYYSNLYSMVSGLGFLTNSLGTWPAYLRLTTNSAIFGAILKLMFISFAVLAGSVIIAGARIRRTWQDEPPSGRQVWLQKTFCTPVLWVGFLKRWMRWKLEHNPIGWLEQRTWTGRLVTWGWFAVIISLYSAALTDSDFFHNYSAMHRITAWFLALTIAASSAGSFQRERETGVLELLLVSPVGEAAIVSGRVRGLWGQFLPTVVLLLGVWAYCGTILPPSYNTSDRETILFHAATFLTLPVIGLYFSLRCRNFISALLCTLAVGLLLPLVAAPVLRVLKWLVESGDSNFYWSEHLPIWAACCQCAIAALCWPRLLARLRNRSFLIEKSGPGN